MSQKSKYKKIACCILAKNLQYVRLTLFCANIFGSDKIYFSGTTTLFLQYHETFLSETLGLYYITINV